MNRTLRNSASANTILRQRRCCDKHYLAATDRACCRKLAQRVQPFGGAANMASAKRRGIRFELEDEFSKCADEADPARIARAAGRDGEIARRICALRIAQPREARGGRMCGDSGARMAAARG